MSKYFHCEVRDDNLNIFNLKDSNGIEVCLDGIELLIGKVILLDKTQRYKINQSYSSLL
jgi:hypothetical protein